MSRLPFHPPGKPEKLRTKHLGLLETPTLILQGERDPFGKKESHSCRLSPSIRVVFLPDGDHDLKQHRAGLEQQECSDRGHHAFVEDL